MAQVSEGSGVVDLGPLPYFPRVLICFGLCSFPLASAMDRDVAESGLGKLVLHEQGTIKVCSKACEKFSGPGSHPPRLLFLAYWALSLLLPWSLPWVPSPKIRTFNFKPLTQ